MNDCYYTDYVLSYSVYVPSRREWEMTAAVVVTQAHMSQKRPSQLDVSMQNHVEWLTQMGYGQWAVWLKGKAGSYDDMVARREKLFSRGDQLYRETIAGAHKPGPDFL